MNWKRVVSLLLVLVMVGSAMGPALAAGTEQKVPPCPSCSRKVVTIPKGLKVAELKGSSAYFKAIEVFNSKDALKLKEHLKNLNLKPIYDKAVVQIIKYKGITTEVVKIPLKGKKEGLFVYVRNKYGEAIGIGILTSKGMKAYVINNGQISEKLIEANDALKCTVCTVIVGAICKIGIDQASAWGCARVCGIACADLIEDPPAYAICVLGCGYVCLKVMDIIQDYGCAIGAVAICEKVGWC